LERKLEVLDEGGDLLDIFIGKIVCPRLKFPGSEDTASVNRSLVCSVEDQLGDPAAVGGDGQLVAEVVGEDQVEGGIEEDHCRVDDGEGNENVDVVVDACNWEGVGVSPCVRPDQ